MSKPSFLPCSLAWRRFFARSFDLGLEILLLETILNGDLVDFSKYPLWIQILKSMIELPFCLIIHAFICHYFGTSWGKYLFGISVNKVAGKMSLKDWLLRSFRLWKSGFAFGIPILKLWAHNKQKKLLNNNEQTTYDTLSGIYVTADKRSKFQIVKAIFLSIIILIIIFVILIIFRKLLLKLLT